MQGTPTPCFGSLLVKQAGPSPRSMDSGSQARPAGIIEEPQGASRHTAHAGRVSREHHVARWCLLCESGPGSVPALLSEQNNLQKVHGDTERRGRPGSASAESLSVRCHAEAPAAPAGVGAFLPQEELG